jgi:hypothetical protein
MTESVREGHLSRLEKSLRDASVRLALVRSPLLTFDCLPSKRACQETVPPIESRLLTEYFLPSGKNSRLSSI